MDAMELLHSRVSIPVLGEPGPDPEQLDAIYRAALRAPDHGVLRPWRFLEISGDGRAALGEVFLEAARGDCGEVAPEQAEKIRNMAMRAPMVLVVLAVTQEHDRVPEIEQIISAGCAAQNMMLAVHALGLGAMWRTGTYAFHPHVKRALGLDDSEHIIGFLYVGTPSGSIKKLPELDPADFVETWNGPREG